MKPNSTFLFLKHPTICRTVQLYRISIISDLCIMLYIQIMYNGKRAIHICTSF